MKADLPPPDAGPMAATVPSGAMSAHWRFFCSPAGKSGRVRVSYSNTFFGVISPSPAMIASNSSLPLMSLMVSILSVGGPFLPDKRDITPDPMKHLIRVYPHYGGHD